MKTSVQQSLLTSVVSLVLLAFLTACASSPKQGAMSATAEEQMKTEEAQVVSNERNPASTKMHKKFKKQQKHGRKDQKHQ